MENNYMASFSISGRVINDPKERSFVARNGKEYSMIDATICTNEMHDGSDLSYCCIEMSFFNDDTNKQIIRKNAFLDVDGFVETRRYVNPATNKQSSFISLKPRGVMAKNYAEPLKEVVMPKTERAIKNQFNDTMPTDYEKTRKPYNFDQSGDLPF